MNEGLQGLHDRAHFLSGLGNFLLFAHRPLQGIWLRGISHSALVASILALL